MITYVDTSALLKLLVEEDGSDRAAEVWDAAASVASASLVVVESRAALAAAERGGRLSAAGLAAAERELTSLLDGLHLVRVTDELVQRAGDLAESEALRGYDAVHLAAALTVGATVLACADWDLCDAAERHDLHVANPLAG